MVRVLVSGGSPGFVERGSWRKHGSPRSRQRVQAWGVPQRHRVPSAVAAILCVMTALPGTTPAVDGLPQVFPSDHARYRFDGATHRYLNDNQHLQIDQSAERAVLHWQRFDIAADKSVEFRQPSASAIALNRVLGEEGASLIDGRLEANGRVFLINQNGILFGDNARVNVNSLIASTFDIDDEIFEGVGFVNAINRPDGDQNTPDEDFAAFDIRHNPDPDAEPGAIECAPGCRIVSGENGRIMLFAPSVVNRGHLSSPQGQIVAAAPEDRVYIAAEDDEFRGLLVEVKTGAEPSDDDPYRGVHNLGEMIAERGNISLVGMAVNQRGLVRATTGVSLDGSVRLMAQDMSGPALDLTGDNPNSPIADRGGRLDLGPNSITEVVPDASAATAVDAQAQAPSRITLNAERIALAAGARVTATGGEVSIKARSNPSNNNNLGRVSIPGEDAPEVVIEPGAVIDVSGDGSTQVSVARNFVEVEARGNELADSPLQRDGALRNKTLVVDMRRGTPLLNADAAIAGAIQRDARERLSPGGTIRIESEGRIQVGDGARLDIRGGQVAYASATVASSLLLTADGRVVDISEADPNVRYLGVLGDIDVEYAKWGITETIPNLLGLGSRNLEPGYIEGKDAGELILTAPEIAFGGELLAAATLGPLQRLAPSLDEDVQAFARRFDQVPLGGRLELNLLDGRFPDLFVGEASDAPAANGHPISTGEPLVLPADLIPASGLSRVSLTASGRVLINAPIALPASGELELTGTQVVVNDPIRAPGGTVAIARQTAFEGSPAFPAPLLDQAALAAINADIDTSGTWTNDGQLVNPDTPTGPVVLQGGRILIGAALDDQGAARAWTEIALGSAATLDVSGGAQLAASGDLMGGSAGEIRLRSGALTDGQPSRLTVAGELRGFGIERGGHLGIAADEILVGSIGLSSDSELELNGQRQFLNVDSDLLAEWEAQRLGSEDGLWPGLDLWSDAQGLSEAQLAAWDVSLAIGRGISRNLLVVDASTFRKGGFQSFALSADRAGLGILPGNEIRLDAANQVLGPALATAPSADSLEGFSELVRLADYDRLPVDLMLNSSKIGALNLGSGASILADAGASVALESVASVFVDGTIQAAAGDISIGQDGVRGTFAAARKVWLGPNARLLAPGAVRISPISLFGERIGEVLDAGRIEVYAKQGALIGEAGALIGVDGTAAQLNTGRGSIEPLSWVGGRAGEITLSASEALAYAGRLLGQAVLDEEGGRLSVTLSPDSRGRTPQAPYSPVFDLGPGVAVMGGFDGWLPGPDGSIDAALQNTAFVPVDQIAPGGFDSLRVSVRGSADGSGQRPRGIEEGTGEDVVAVPDTLESISVIEFPEDLTLALERSLELDAAVLRTAGQNEVVLEAAHVAMGSADTRVRLDGSVPDVIIGDDGLAQDNPDQQLVLEPQPGEGQLRVTGELVELVGELVTQGFGSPGGTGPGVQIQASEDLRLRGVRTAGREVYDGLFRTAGDLTIEASRVYPTTLTEFELSAVGTGATVSIDGRGDGDAPLSLGGVLQVHADHIRQAGSVFAPLGRLDLIAGSTLELGAGSLTSTSANGVSAPFFRTQPGGDLMVPRSDSAELNIVFVDEVESPAFERVLPEQSLNLVAPDIAIRDGAEFDLRGGLEAHATEFVPGPGGSRDILLAALDFGAGVEANPSFAIVPGLGQFAPYDPLETPASEVSQDLRIGDTLILEEGMSGLPAGEYAILPPRYALFGGYLITPAAGTLDIAAGAELSRADGAPILAGRYGVAGSDTAGSRFQGFAVEDGSRVRTRAEYLETPLGDLYAEASTLRHPDDAGTLVVDAGTSLSLGGRIVPGGVSGARGAQVDILADQVLSIGSGSGIVLDVAQIEGLGADSLLIGGRRSQVADGTLIDPESEEIVVADGVSLSVPELILVADRVSVGSTAISSGSTLLESPGPASGDMAQLRIEDGDGPSDAAVVAVSNRALTIERPGSSGVAGGSLAVSSDTILRASGAVVADVAGDADFSALIDAPGALISLGASHIGLGETDVLGLTEGMVLSNEALMRLAGSDLRLRSGSEISIYGALPGSASMDGLRFASLAFDAQGIVGLDNDGKSVRLAADAISLSNNSESTLGPIGPQPAAGTLELATDRLLLGRGLFTIQGFGSIDAQAEVEVRATGDAQLLAEAELALNAPVITAETGVDAAVEVRGAGLAVGRSTTLPADPLAAGGLGASFLFQGDQVDFGGHVLLPSGRLAIQAEEQLAIASGAVLDLAGLSAAFGPTTVATPGGTIELSATAGSILIASETILDVSPSPAEGAAGTVAITAPEGGLWIDPGTRFQSGPDGGNFSVYAEYLMVTATAPTLDAGGLVLPVAAGSLAPEAFSDLQALLGTGFSSSRKARLRDQSMTLRELDQIRAHEVRIVSDRGDVRVHGVIDASGLELGSVTENGGTIVLAAGDSVVIESTAVLRATGALGADGNPAPGTEGGTVELIALDSDGSDSPGDVDWVDLVSGSLIDVSGGEVLVPPEGERVVRAPEQTGGKVLLHTRRLDLDGDHQTETLVLGETGARIRGASSVTLVATQVIRPGDRVGATTFDGASLTSASTDAIQDEIGAFFDTVDATIGDFTVVPGIELIAPGDLVLEDTWDFYDGWRFGASGNGSGPAGALTLRSAGNLILGEALTDAFFDAPGLGFGSFVLAPDYLDRLSTAGPLDADGRPLPPASWGYRLVAGADVASADVSAVVLGAGDLEVHEVVRTGTADIAVATGGSLILEPGAAIYTGGFNLGLSENVETVIPAFGAFDAGLSFNSWMGGGAQFPTGGGDVRVFACGDILGSGEQAAPTVWQPRIGEASPGAAGLARDAGAVPSHWGIAFHRFADGIGVLGGGTLEIETDGDLSNLSLAVPTTGRAIAGAVPGSTAGRFGVALETTEVAGGGLLRVDVGGDLVGGSLHLGEGHALVSLGGAAVPGSNAGLSIYSGFSAQIELVSRDGLSISGISDATVVALSERQADFELKKSSPNRSVQADPTGYYDNRFFTFEESAGVEVQSLAGHLDFSGPGFATAIPPILRAVSHSGDISIVDDIDQYPSSVGQLELLAAGDIVGASSVVGLSPVLRQSDQDPSLLPSIDAPDTRDFLSKHAEVPIHLGDDRPNLIVARDGSVMAQDSLRWRLDLAKASIFQAGEDLRDLSVAVQNVKSEDVTAFIAGRDIVQRTLRDVSSEFSVPAENSNPDSITKYEIAGPGAALFVAGRSISLGTSEGIESIGDAKNIFLDDEGADLLLIAGVGEEPAHDEFVRAYLFDQDIYTASTGSCGDSCRSELEVFLSQLRVPVLDNDPLATFLSLDALQQRLFIADILLNELKESGNHATDQGSQDYSRGFAAIETLFPTSNPDGGISLLLSQVQTLDGGDIEMLVPGGDINAGAADSDIIDKGAKDLGIVTALDGDIGVFVDGDFLVNSTRAFALQGDLLVWSSNGSIDAGKGAKTVSSIPDPIARIGPAGETIIEFPPAVEGSGLQGVNAFLFAPRGVVNAGDAGIRTIGDLTIGATEIIGADNIDIGGAALGFSLGPPPSIAIGFTGVTGVSASTSKVAEEATASQVAGEADESSALAGQSLALLDVEVIGFGD